MSSRTTALLLLLSLAAVAHAQYSSGGLYNSGSSTQVGRFSRLFILMYITMLSLCITLLESLMVISLPLVVVDSFTAIH